MENKLNEEKIIKWESFISSFRFYLAKNTHIIIIITIRNDYDDKYYIIYIFKKKRNKERKLNLK